MGVGYILPVLNKNEKFLLNIPSSVYSGFGNSERITYTQKEGYVETPDLKNKNYMVFGLKTGISVEFKFYERFYFGLSNYVDYELDGKRPTSSLPVGSKLYVWNPCFSLMFIP